MGRWWRDETQLEGNQLVHKLVNVEKLFITSGWNPLDVRWFMVKLFGWYWWGSKEKLELCTWFGTNSPPGRDKDHFWDLYWGRWLWPVTKSKQDLIDIEEQLKPVLLGCRLSSKGRKLVNWSSTLNGGIDGVLWMLTGFVCFTSYISGNESTWSWFVARFCFYISKPLHSRH